MSLARKHRDSFSARTTQADAPSEASGLATDTTAPVSASAAPSLARAHRDRALAEASAVEQVAVASVAETGTEAERAAAQMNLRLQADLRRLRDIKSIEKKIETKRELLPHYAAWVDGLVAAGVAAEEDVLPTIMIWRIDTGDFPGAMALVEHVLAHGLPLPARYERSAPDLIVEEIADAALRLQAGESFSLPILQRVAELTDEADMHDQIRAKLFKAIGIEQMRAAEDETAEPLPRSAVAALALATLQRAHKLNDRVGVKDRIKKLEKLLTPKSDQAPAGA